MKKSFFFILLAAVLLMLLPMTALAETATVKYIDEKGVERSHECIIMESGDDYTFEAGKWYAVTKDATIKNRIINNGEISPANLILADGCTLTAEKGIQNVELYHLVIYGQSSGTGTIIAKADNFYAGIGGNYGTNKHGGSVTINGGTVNATGGIYAAGIGGAYGGSSEISGAGGTIIINSGTVNATGGFQAAGIGSGGSAYGDYDYSTSITINGGIVVAQGGQYGTGIGDSYSQVVDDTSLSINGGTVTAIAGERTTTEQRKTSVFVDKLTIKDGLLVFSGSSKETAARSDIEGVRSSYYAYITSGTTYTVSHLWQKADAYGYEQHETETLIGLSGAQTAAVAKTYDGFHAQSFKQKEITTDGKTVVEIKYSRKSYRIQFVAYKCTNPYSISARYGSVVTVDAGDLSAAGYVFNGWYEDEACTQKFNMPQTIIMPSHNITLYAGWNAKTDTPYYDIIVGADQVVLTTADSAVFSSNANFDKFVRVEVDSKEVSSKYYTAKSGSTVITFNKEYISTLKEGKHTLRIVSKDGSASTGFKVTPLPETGDNTNLLLLTMLLFTSVGTALLISAKTRKRNKDK